MIVPLPEALRAQAAALYWQAFAPKLGRLLGPEPRALAFITATLDPNHALAALSAEGALLGVVGFRSPRGGFVAGDLRGDYGRFGGLWRGAVLRWFGRGPRLSALMVDGLIVSPQARGQGIGTRLLQALAAEAQARGYPALRLEVAHGNPAQALYLRLGFRPIATRESLFLRLAFGLAGLTVMELAL